MKKYLFPYELVSQGDRIVLYGGGFIGRCYAEQIKKNPYCKILGIVDANHEKIGKIGNLPVFAPEKLKETDYDKILISTGKYRDEVFALLQEMGVEKDKILIPDFFGCNLETTESIVIKTVFDALDVEKPSYIDVGACRPYKLSNTMLFYYNGSRGINIEPQKSLAPDFEKYRPEDINLFVGVAAQRGEGKLYQCQEPSLSTFRTDVRDWSAVHHHGDYLGDYAIVPFVTLNDIVDEYCDGKFPDFLDVDIEGMDASVLETVDFSKNAPKVICVEGFPDVFNKILMNKECPNGGYKPYCRIGCNTIYLRNDIYDKVLCLQE